MSRSPLARRRRALPSFATSSRASSSGKGSPRAPLAVTLLLAALPFVGCAPPPAPPPPPKPTEVKFILPVERPVVPFEEFGGRAASPDLVELRGRVSGYLTKANFTDGAMVQAGDVLFEIEDSIYKANLAQAEAIVLQRRADVSRLKAQLVRSKRLVVSQAATEQEVENLTFETAAAEAAQLGAEAARDRAKVDVEFTKVVAPISGRIGRRMIDPGNLVLADETLLATIVATDPIHAYFDYDERSILAMRRLVDEGKLTEAPDRTQSVQVSLVGEDKYGLEGKINWVDNQIDMNTGTLRARVEVANHTGLLSPGMFVRLRVPLGPEEMALLIPEDALGADQGQRFVYVVNAKDEIEYRRVEIGWLIDGKRVIRSGLSTGDRVVVTGLQRIRPGAKVDPKALTSTESTSESSAAAAAPAQPPAKSINETEKPSIVAPPPFPQTVSEDSRSEKKKFDSTGRGAK